MDAEGKPICVYTDERVLQPLDKYAKKHHISRSAAIRLIVSDFFLKKETC